MTATNTAAPYTLISSDCHAGGNMKAYEEYLAQAYREAFAEWRGAHSNPLRALQEDGRSRHWAHDRRNGDLDPEGVAAAIRFPHNRTPSLPTVAPTPPPPPTPQRASPHAARPRADPHRPATPPPPTRSHPPACPAARLPPTSARHSADPTRVSHPPPSPPPAAPHQPTPAPATPRQGRDARRGAGRRDSPGRNAAAKRDG